MVKSLQDALKEALADDGTITRYEARALREMVMADGIVSQDERELLQAALENNEFDDKAFELFQSMLLRARMKD